MASKKDFLEFPATDFCTTILSMGPPRSGKTYLMLKCVKEWLEMGMFEKYVMVLPSFKNEADGSYDWLMEHENVTVYESYHDHIGKQLLRNKKRTTYFLRLVNWNKSHVSSFALMMPRVKVKTYLRPPQ
jgi:hypothetical protein